MNTTSHVILGLFPQLALDKKAEKKKTLVLAGIAGSLNPDLPMVLFFFFTSFILGQEQQVIWSESYYHPGWQAFFNAYNSIPLYLIGFLILWLLKKMPGAAFFLGGLFHSILDLPLHHDDGHAHFWPFSDWVFHSPLSYWDPAHHGKWFAPVEFLLVLFVSYKLWPEKGKTAKVLIVLANLFNLFSTVGTYFFFGSAA